MRSNPDSETLAAWLLTIGTLMVTAGVSLGLGPSWAMIFLGAVLMVLGHASWMAR